MRRITRIAVLSIAAPAALALPAPAAYADEQVCVSIELDEYSSSPQHASGNVPEAGELHCATYRDLEVDPIVFVPTTVQTPEVCVLTLPCVESTSEDVDTPVVNVRQYPGAPAVTRDGYATDASSYDVEGADARSYCLVVRMGPNTSYGNPVVLSACAGTVDEIGSYQPVEPYSPLVRTGTIPVVSIGSACVGTACTPAVSLEAPLYTLATTLPGTRPVPLRVHVLGTPIL